MFAFFDGAILTALSLFVALMLGYYAEAHPDWRVFTNEASSSTIAIALTTTLVIGCVGSSIACMEHGLPVLPWMALFLAIQAATVVAYGLVKHALAGRVVPTI